MRDRRTGKPGVMKRGLLTGLAGGLLALMTAPGVIVYTHNNVWWAMADGLSAVVVCLAISARPK